MKLILSAFVTLTLLLTFSSETFGQEFSKIDKSPMDAAYYPPKAAFRGFAKTEEAKMTDLPIIRVLYSRPSKNGRKVFTDLHKPGEMWRAGANESAEILFLEDVMIGDSKVKAGRYTFYTKLGTDNWEVHFNTDVDGWGHYHYDEAKTVASITVPVEKVDDTIEVFSIIFEKSDDGAHMIMGWDDTIAQSTN